MLSLKSLSHILLATIQWMLFWGLVAAAFVAIVTTIQPDTGHVPRAEVPLMIGVPSAILGGIVGLIFACLMEASHQRNFLGRTVRVFVVGIMGTSAGIIVMNVLIPSLIGVSLIFFVGIVLTIRFACLAGRRSA